MKRLAIFTIILGIALITQAQVQFKWGNFDHAFVASTDADTSSTFNSKPTMSFNVWASDTLNADSVAIEFFLDLSVIPDSSDWIVVDSLTVTTDSIWTPWIPTEFAIPSFPYYRIRKVGQAGNSVDSSIETKVQESLADNRR